MSRHSLFAPALALACCLLGCGRQTIPASLSPSAIARLGLPAAVTLHTFDTHGEPFMQGSGFLLTGTGLGATNLHVLNGAQSAQATLARGRIFSVLGVVAYDPWHDVAIFQLGRDLGGKVTLPAGLAHVPVGSAAALQPGDPLVAIGSPQGFASTVATGILSGRSDGFLQMSVPISPGSSGSAIFAASGQVVGMATFLVRHGEDLSFATPGQLIRATVNQPAGFLPVSRLWTDAAGRLMVGQRSQPVIIGAGTDGGDEVAIYAGRVSNDSAGASARGGFALMVHAGRLRGCFAVAAPLAGSGWASGRRGRHGAVTLTSTGEGNTIRWRGRFDPKDALAGSYEVRAGGRRQHGHFQFKLVATLEPPPHFSASTCPGDAELPATPTAHAGK